MDSAQQSRRPVGQAVFLRTDTPDYEELSLEFHSLEEMVRICSTGRPHCVLENVVVYADLGEEEHSLTLGFVSASKGHRPASISSLH